MRYNGRDEGWGIVVLRGGVGCNIVSQITPPHGMEGGAIFTLLRGGLVNFTTNCYSKDCIV